MQLDEVLPFLYSNSREMTLDQLDLLSDKLGVQEKYRELKNSGIIRSRAELLKILFEELKTSNPDTTYANLKDAFFKLIRTSQAH